MKILFVSSGNKKTGIGSIVKNQGKSLVEQNIEIDYFPISGKGVWGYFQNIFKIRNYLCKNHFDIVHAHYSLSGFVASLAGARNLIVSLMGSDAYGSLIQRQAIRVFNKIFWSACIVKSTTMAHKLRMPKTFIIPNGVDLSLFKPMSKEECKNKLNFDSKKKHILFMTDPDRKEKNFELAKRANDHLNRSDIELKVIHGAPHAIIPLYMNAADVLLLTSTWEGSPNVIKESMACNLPIVSTEVGDVKKLTRHTQGCFITTFDSKDIASKLQRALSFPGKTNGREQIKHLDSKQIAKRIIKLYNSIINH